MEGFRAGPGPGEWQFGPLSGYPGSVVMGRDSAVRFAPDGIISVAAEGRCELKYSRIDGDYLDVSRRGVPDSLARKLLRLLGWIASDSWGEFMSDDGWTRLNLVLLRPLAGAELRLDTPPCRDWEARAVEELFGMLMRRKAMQLLADEQWVRLTLRPLVSGSSGRAGERHPIPETSGAGGSTRP